MSRPASSVYLVRLGKSIGKRGSWRGRNPPRSRWGGRRVSNARARTGGRTTTRSDWLTRRCRFPSWDQLSQPLVLRGQVTNSIPCFFPTYGTQVAYELSAFLQAQKSGAGSNAVKCEVIEWVRSRDQGVDLFSFFHLTLRKPVSAIYTFYLQIWKSRTAESP